ncbi:hypothetical protein Agub_g6107 [Astrephomene gubernaculifera]|uniref:non-specific serine/threonine protein kinase n=1 Tax=Astrephomene gubernaculifera TaxID=47775 RepID=A0AAD3DMT7_9CHLO|nr:hypothetical protein Agub_g6107 [Astrephomene gubernaculifera]
MEKYNRGKVLGKGSFGCAILVTNKLDNKNYVIKEIDISRMPKTERDAAEQEAKLLMALNHPNIVRCIECFTHLNKLCIVMDWCSEGDLYGMMQKRRGQQLSEDTILDWFVQMCLGLKHVHDRKILHRDIKTQNVFMSAGGLLKLGDFGVSKVLNSTFQLATTAVGTPYYLSPEICQNRKYNQKSDIWSLGCVLYELATLKHAFEAPNMRALIQKIIKGSYPPMPPTRSRDLRELCDRMLTLDWQKRPSINDILATPVMKARIQKFLSSTLQAHEFSHTIIHGRPRPGQLVVGAPAPGGGPPAAAAGGMAGGLAPPKPGGVSPSPQAMAAAAAAAAPHRPSAAASPSPAARPSAAASPAPIRVPSPSNPSRAAAAGAAGGAAAAGGVAGFVGLRGQAQDAVAVARAKAAEAAKLREEAMLALARKAQPNVPQLPCPWVRPASAHRQCPPSPPAPEADRLPRLPTSSAKRAAEAESNAKREVERARAREVAALGAQREIERLKLEEQRRKLEADRVRMEGERRKREAAQAEEVRRAKAAEEARARQSAEEARRQKELEARRRRAEEEARKKDAERAAKEKEREDLRARIAAQRKEFQDRQAEAARNRAAAEHQLGRGAPEVQVLAGGGRPSRRHWSPPRVEEGARGAAGEDGDEGAAGRGGAGAGAGAGRRGNEDYLSAEQRRAVWEEQRAAAERNKRAAQEAERHGGLAEFLGVPRGGDDSDEGRHGPSSRHRHHQATPQGAAAAAAGGPRASPAAAAAGADISPDARRAAYLEMRAAAERNRAAVEGSDRPGRGQATPPAAGAAGGGRPVSHASPASRAGTPPQVPSRPPPSPPAAAPTDPWAARMARLEEERRRRELEILEFQRQHREEMREACQRNRRQMFAEVRGTDAPSEAGGPPAQSTPAAAAAPAAGRANGGAHGGAAAAAVDQQQPAGGPEEDDIDFAAMVKDMQDVLLQDAAGGAGCRSSDEDEDDIYNDDKHSAALAGQFMLNGQAVQLPGVREGDSLALKVEALRVFLETHLGTDPFLRVYRRLESLSVDDDEAAVSAEFLAALGQEKLPYLQLVHQLIVCEENMHAEGAAV